tara:strand:+ start:5158 stop:6621 length:1464 start_codon:yes stop_codon:yes gene_type:complete
VNQSCAKNQEAISPTRRWVSIAICVAIGSALWFSPAPEGVNEDGWHLLAVFVSTIASFILRPFSMATMVLVALLVLTLTKTFGETSKEALQVAVGGYGNTTVWLVIAAFLISGTVIRSGLGRRIALSLIHRLGRTETGLAYGIGAAELILGPIVPSNTARGGGILAPIVDSLCRSLVNGDEAKRHNKVSEYLVLCGAHSNLITAAMFLTGMAANPLIAEAASDVAGVEFGWGTWALGSIVPGLAALILLPHFLKRIVRPPKMSVASAHEQAGRDLKEMGPVTRQEMILIGVFVTMLILWSTASWHHIHTAVVALLGVVILLLTRAESWQNMSQNKGAWDAMVWLGGLIMMAGQLKELGIIEWFAENTGVWVKDLGPLTAALVLALIYFYSMYAFSMLTGHITAMVAAFLAVATVSGTPPLLMVALLAYFSNLCGCLTNYSTGPVVIYFGLGYHSPKRWFQIGLLVSFFHLFVWLGLGLPWWKFLGWW